MISLIFLLLASICNAIMDVVKYKYDMSIFKTDNPFWHLWWSSTAKRRKIIQLNDAWHFFKMWMVVFFIIAIIYYTPLVTYFHYDILNKLCDFFAFGILWNLGFNLCYDVVFIKDKDEL